MTELEEKQLETIKQLMKLVLKMRNSMNGMLISLTHDKDEGQYSDDVKAAFALLEIADTI